MKVKDSLASVAFESIASRLFGADAFVTEDMPEGEVTRWIQHVISLSFNRWRKRLKARIGALKKAKDQADVAFAGTCNNANTQPR